MRTKTLQNAKLVVTVKSDKQAHTIKTVSIFDNRTREYLTDEYIQERGIESFLDLNNMKETLNWNLNGNSTKYQFKWGQTVKQKSEGRAYVFD